MTFQTASVRKVLCSVHLTTNLLTNNEKFDVGISKRLKLKDIDAVLTILDPTVMSQHKFE